MGVRAGEGALHACAYARPTPPRHARTRGTGVGGGPKTGVTRNGPRLRDGSGHVPQLRQAHRQEDSGDEAGFVQGEGEEADGGFSSFEHQARLAVDECESAFAVAVLLADSKSVAASWAVAVVMPRSP
jgi:hypothetical protein